MCIIYVLYILYIYIVYYIYILCIYILSIYIYYIISYYIILYCIILYYIYIHPRTISSLDDWFTTFRFDTPSSRPGIDFFDKKTSPVFSTEASSGISRNSSDGSGWQRLTGQHGEGRRFGVESVIQKWVESEIIIDYNRLIVTDYNRLYLDKNDWIV